MIIFLIGVSLSPAAIGVGVLFRETRCYWKHGTSIIGAIDRYNRIQKRRWEEARRRAKESEDPPPPPKNRMMYPEL